MLATQLGDAFSAHKQYHWGLCYRMTGSAADADDLVQDTFTRAITKPPARLDEPLRPWLVRVAMNLSRDMLRRRRRRGYVGTWLPSPVEPASYELSGDDRPTTAGRYDLLESVSFAFLLALEALTPQQRAVLLLSDGGGEFFAARVPVVGRAKVSHFYQKISRMRGPPISVDMRIVNGPPALVARFAPGGDKDAPLAVTRVDVGPDGSIVAIHSVLASAKLTAITT